MNVAVVGYGSIGKRHERVLAGMGNLVHIVSQQGLGKPVHSTLSCLMAALPDCEYVVIANPTAMHHAAIAELALTGFSGRVLVEKPLFDRDLSLPENSFASCYVGYNLRFHPVLQRLKKLLEGETVISVNAYAGQYLPDWRPDRDYRLSYSASREDGGGVLRDLSHELDYCTWLFGDWKRVSAVGGHLSDLEITTEDCVSLLIQTEKCSAVTIHLDYLDRAGRREVVVHSLRHSFKVDFVAGTLQVDKQPAQLHAIADKDASYRRQHEAVLGTTPGDLCTVKQGQETIRLIEAAHTAAASKRWVERC